MPAFTKRMLITVSLGAISGLICAYVADFFVVSDPMFWIIFLNRVLIGIVVGVSGFVTRHPFFFFPCYALRGIFFGAILSLLVSLEMLLHPQTEEIMIAFWTFIVAGAVLGLLIDLVSTKVAGQGKDLLQK